MTMGSDRSGGGLLPRTVLLPLVQLAVLGGFPPAQATLLHVPQDYSTIQTALNATSTGDTVRVAPGTYYEHLVTPIWSVTMLSDYTWTGDSLDIERTIVDGSWTGTVLTVNAWWTGHFHLEGFTLQRGMGDAASESAGGVHLRDWANATFRHVVFKEHRSPPEWPQVLDGIYVEGFRGRLVLEDLRIELDSLNLGGDESLTQVGVSGWRYVEARRIRFKQAPHVGSLFGFYADSVVVADVVVDRSEYPFIPTTGVLGANGNQYLAVDSLSVRHSTFTWMPIMLSGADDGTIQVTNLHLEDLHLQLPESWMYNSDGFVEISGGRVLVENWTHRNCTTNMGRSLGYVIGYEGVIRNLLAENVVSGSILSAQADCDGGCIGGGLWVDGLSLDHVTISGATINPLDTAPPAWATISPSVIYANAEAFHTSDTLSFRNVEVSHVVDNDPDDYSLPETDCTASLGRAFQFYTGDIQRPLTVIMDSCRFVENRQPNTQPERMPQNPNPGGARMVGSTVRFEGAPLEDTRLIIRNTTLMHNDDGGLEAGNFRELDVDNVVLVNNSRMGTMLVAVDSTIINGLFISGTESYLAQLQYPYSYDYPSWQCVADIRGLNGTRIGNVTFCDNNTEFLFRGSREDFNDVSWYVNSIFSRNTYDYFTNPWYDVTLFPPPLFDYCFLPVSQPGMGNMIGQDAGFDLERGAPFLASDSPCVDAGNPNPAFNDVEDPASPGFPLWPAQGSLRNDMGFTGGPYAVALDTSWVSVPTWRPTTLPKDFILGSPWPNPFNPATHIAFTLTRPGQTRLTVHNLLGQEVAVLVNGIVPAGAHQVAFRPDRQASGLYLVTLEVSGQVETRAVTLLR